MINLTQLKKLSIVFALLFSCLMTIAQSPKTVVTLKQLTDSIGRLVQQRQIPGLMVGITTKDSVIYAGRFGFADVAKKLPVKPLTLFRMGSITKSLISVAVLKLVEQGKMSLHDTLSKVAPEVPFVNDWEATNPIRVVDLLEQTSGFDDFKLNKMYSLDHKAYSTKEMMLQQKSSMVTRWRPGERYTYCNVNYVILGYLISKVTGQEYDQYLTKQVLRPLAMMHSNFNLWSAQPAVDAKEYRFSDGEFQEVPSVALLPGPSGALWSNADDMMKFVRLLLNNGYPLLSAASISRFESAKNSLAARAGLKSGYALGNEDFGRFRGHDGMLGTFRSSYRYDRQTGVGFVIATNAGGIGKIEDLIANYLLKDRPLQQVEVQPLNMKEMEGYLGYYQAQDPRFKLLAFVDRLMFIKIEKDSAHLYMNILGKRYPLQQTAPGMFSQPGANQPTVAFTKNQDGLRVLLINKHYCEKVSGFVAIPERVVLLMALILALISVLTGLIAIARYTLKQLNNNQLILSALPMLSVLGLIGGSLCFSEVMNNSYLLYQFNSLTLRSMAITLGFTSSCILAIFNLFFLLKRYSCIMNRFFRFYLFALALSLILLNIPLAMYGWIGLCTWTL